MRPSLPVRGTCGTCNSSKRKGTARLGRSGKFDRLEIRAGERAKPGVTTLLLILALFIFDFGGAALALPPAARPGEMVLDRYLAAAQDQRSKLADLSMEVDMEASLPKLNKTGKLHAWRYVTRLGAITYRALTIQGDNTVKKDVIARYLQAEKEAGEKQGLGITRENYKFEYRGEYPWGDGKLHLFYVEPRRKQVGLFEGWVWIDDASGLPVREQGELSKNPSVFLKKVAFVRDYIHQDGVAIPVSIDSLIQTRIIGSAEVKVRYRNITKQARADKLVTSATRQQ